MSPSLARQRRAVLRSRPAYALVTAVIGLGLFASVTPSPLYHTYSALFGFSPLLLTLVYATYAFGVLASLLVAGRVSDQAGRRPVLLIALGALLTSTLLFMGAASLAWLFFARGLQGLATGLLLSAASAGLLDLHPRADARAAALANGVASTVGLALGMFASSALVAWGNNPLLLPYALLFALVLAALVGAYFLPERGGNGPWRLSLQRPHIPPVARRAFFLASLAVFSSWSIGGLFFSLGPQLAGRIFHSHHAVVASIGVVALTASAAVGQMAYGARAPWLSATAGALALACGMAAIVTAAATDSRALFLTGSIVGGVGFGLAFQGGLRVLVSVIPPEHRAAVMSAFFIVAYASLSLPAIVAGLLVRPLGLARTFELFGLGAAAVALLVAREAYRTRPSIQDAATFAIPEKKT